MSTYWDFKSIARYEIFYENNIINFINPQDPYKPIYDILSKNTDYTIKFISNDNINDLKNFLDSNYKYIFELDTLRWLIFNPHYIKELNILLYHNDKIIASIIGIKRTISINKNLYDCIHVTLLAVEETYRNMGIHFYIIDILMINARNNNIFLALFNTNKAIKNVKPVKIDNTYIVINKYYSDNHISNFNYELLNKKKSDLYFYYNKSEFNYWFNNKYIITISRNNNFLALLKVYTKDRIPLFVMIEMHNHNNNFDKKTIPNNSILYSEIKPFNCEKLKTRLYTYIYNFGFNSLSCEIYLF